MANPSPQIFRDAAGMRAFSREQRRQGKTIGFVPTMVRFVYRKGFAACLLLHPRLSGVLCRRCAQGYLHDGHISLVRAAGCDVMAARIPG